LKNLHYDARSEKHQIDRVVFRSLEAYTGYPTANTTLDYKRNFSVFRVETTSPALIKENFFLVVYCCNTLKPEFQLNNV